MLELIIGVALGYFFKPQIEKVLGRALVKVKVRSREERRHKRYEDY